MKKGNTKKASKGSDRAGIELIQRAATIYRKKAQTGQIDRAYFIYFANLETSLENMLENFAQ